MKMKMLKKKLLCLAIAAVMTASNAGCGKGPSAADAMDDSQSQPAVKDSEEKDQQENTGSDQAWEPEELDTSERVDFIIYELGDAPADLDLVEEKINEILLEKVNATLEFQFSTWTDWQNKYNMQLTTGGVDLIYTANWAEYGKLASSGAFVPLDNLLDKVSPGVRELLGEDVLNQCRVGGELYTIPCNYMEYTCNGILYREDLRKKYDLPVPDSLENMEAYLAGIKEKEPDQPLLTEVAAQVLNFKYPWVTFAGLPYGLSINHDTPVQIDDYWFSDDFVDDMKLMKKWADMGFWSRSILGNDNESQDGAFENGLAVMYVSGYNPSKAMSVKETLAKSHPDWEAEFIAFGQTNGVIYPANMQTNGTAIAKDCKNPERAMKVVELLLTDPELNALVMYGVEGVHYELDEKGVYHNLSERFTYEGMNTWNFRNKEIMLSSESSVELNKLFGEYEEMGAKMKYPNTDIFGGFTGDTSEVVTEDGAVANVLQEYLGPLQAGMVDDVDAAIKQLRDKLTEAGVETCRENFKKQWLKYCEEYGYQ
ncbi:extracellular solute-binding protein [bacterium D16-50]|nr:extracellular solute-binding protein [bacterium D16-50]